MQEQMKSRKTVMITQSFNDLVNCKPLPYAFRDWQRRLSRNDKLPRGKFFRNKFGGSPLVIMDEMWNLF